MPRATAAERGNRATHGARPCDVCCCRCCASLPCSREWRPHSSARARAAGATEWRRAVRRTGLQPGPESTDPALAGPVSRAATVRDTRGARAGGARTRAARTAAHHLSCLRSPGSHGPRGVVPTSQHHCRSVERENSSVASARNTVVMESGVRHSNARENRSPTHARRTRDTPPTPCRRVVCTHA